MSQKEKRHLERDERPKPHTKKEIKERRKKKKLREEEREK